MTQVGVRDSAGRFIETFEIFVKLAGPGSVTPINVRLLTTVAELKYLIELVCGIPTNLQLLSHRHHAALTDGDTLGDLRVLPGTRLPVRIAYGYDGLVDAALRGDMKEVLRCVATTKDASGMARRMFVAMFVAAHKGYHYLVDRILCEGCHPDSQTPSGRTALHVACAMGNTSCLDSLLQHGASIDIHDATGKTAAQTAAFCGQQGTQRHLLLYSRILANKVTREKPCTWPTSPRFPRSKLGSSVTPTLSLQDLAISPGPELMITAWSGREHHHHYFEKRPRSAKSSLFQSDTSTSSTESWGSMKDGRKGAQHHQAATDSPEDPSTPHHSMSNEQPTKTRPVHLHDRPKSALSSTAEQSTSKNPSPKLVKFAFEERNSKRCTSMSKYSSYHHRGPTYPRLSDSDHQHSMQAPICSSIPIPGPHEQIGNDRHRTALRNVLDTTEKQDETSTPKVHKLEHRSTSRPLSANYRVVHHDQTEDNVADDVSLESSKHSDQEEDLKEANDMRINYLNDKLRAMVGLPVQHPQRLEYMREEDDRQLRSSSPTKMTRKPTPEENEKAFKDWLASKTQDARDRKLVNRVGKMLDDAFGKKDETLISDDDEDQKRKKVPLKFDAWCDKKTTREKRLSDKLASKREQKTKKQLEARLSSGNTVETWLAEKLKKQREERLAEKQRESEGQELKAEQEKAARGVFQKWCMQKEWEELQMLRGRLNDGRKRRPKSGNNKRKAKMQSASARRTQSHSAPPRRHITPAK